MKVLITGGAGFIGSHLVKEWLRRGAEVTVIDNLRTGRIENLEDVMDKISFIEKSICDREVVINAIEGVDYVFNLAAMVSVPESVENMNETVDINVNGLLNILDGCVKHGVKKIVHSSSAAVYGKYPELPSRETDLPKPLSPYAITKLDGEYYLEFYNSEFNLPTVSLRYFNVFGKGQRPDSAYAAAIPAITARSLKNETIEIYGDGEQTRDFIYIQDVVNANILAAENGQGLFNVARGESTSINELVQMIMKITDSESNIVYMDERAGDVKYSTAEISKIKKELGFNPETEIFDGLKNTIEYFKEYFTE